MSVVVRPLRFEREAFSSKKRCGVCSEKVVNYPSRVGSWTPIRGSCPECGWYFGKKLCMIYLRIILVYSNMYDNGFTIL
ncbi:unnamed protein product [Amoebophrya sp. A120]|nr:unnamed protein product [Amoebophrya sp. A120]|eukprot:GSA120T00024136001.1